MNELKKRIKNIRMLITDVDGVLTDGKIILDGEGREIKIFHVHDGSGVVYLGLGGILTGIISGRDSFSLRRRIIEMKIDFYKLGRHDKLKAYKEIKMETGLNDNEIAYIGDDLLDLPVLKRVGCAFSVPEGREEVKKISHYITNTGGGKGAFREVAELILKLQGKWDSIISRYMT